MILNNKLRQFLDRELSIRQFALIRSDRDVARIVEVCEEFCDKLEETTRHIKLSKTAEYKEEMERLMEKLDEIHALAHY